MLALLLTILGMQMTPPPRIPYQQPPRGEVARTYSTVMETNEQAEDKSGIYEYNKMDRRERIPERNREENRQNRPLNPPENYEIYDGNGARSSNPPVNQNGNGGIMPLPLYDGNKVENQSGNGNSTVNPSQNQVENLRKSSKNADSEQFDFAAKKSELDSSYARLDELRAEIAEKFMELERSIDEYNALRGAYNKEMRDAIKEWIKSREKGAND